MSTPMTCEQCNGAVPWRVESEGKWLGACCVPDEMWDAYPGWRAREDLRRERAERAKKNFAPQHAERRLAHV